MSTVATAPSTIPGPRGLPLLGWRGNSFPFLRDPIAYISSIYSRYGEIVGLARGELTQVFAFGPEFNRQLLTDTNLFHTIFETITPARLKRRRRGIGLLNMNGEQHRQQRRLMMPAFHKKAVESYRDDMVAIVDDVLSRWQPGQTFDLAHEMQQLALRIASRTLFGLDATEHAQGVGRLIKQLLETPFFAPSIALFPVNVPGTPYHRMLMLADQLDTEILAMIRRKRAAQSEQADVLAMLIHARDEDGSGMTDAELLGQTTTLLIAGHETTSNALTWTLFLLAQHPWVLANLVDELDSTLRGDAPAVEQLNQLPLLERVIKESMRLLPPASLASRVSTAPFVLGPYEMPKGVFVTWSPYITHRIPALYHEPKRFLPERWEAIDPSPYEYIPFGAGPRMCIGATFAMMEIKLVLAILLQRFQLMTVPDAKVDYQMKITLSPKHGLPVMVARRNEPFIKHGVSGTIHRIIDLN